MKKLNLNSIRIDGGTQPRERINMDAVGDYAEAVKVGIEFPPIVVFYDGAENWLADGFHRWHAHKQAGKASIESDVRTGTLLDAKLFAVGANGAHGLRRSNEDKRRAVQMVLDEPAWDEWSDRKVADACGVSHPFVAAIRKPSLVVRQQENRLNSESRRSPKVESDSTANRLADVATKPIPSDEGAPDEAEIVAAQRAQQDEYDALVKIAQQDDKLGAALAEVKKLTAENRILKERVNSLMNEKNEAIRAAKRWQKKAEAPAA